jgi:hypothetical protein
MVFTEFDWQTMVYRTLGFVLLNLWYVPSLIAFAYGHRRRGVILGLTVFGLPLMFVSFSFPLGPLGIVVLWIFLLVWALRSRRPKS